MTSLVLSLLLSQASCAPAQTLDKYLLLRRLSLDLRGKAPSYEEYLALDSQSGVPQSVIAQFIASNDFKKVMRQYHERLFWPNVTNVQLSNVNSTLQLLGGPDAYALASAGKRKTYRGASDVSTAEGAQCGDYEQTQLDPVTKAPLAVHTSVVNGVTVRQEGWRWVTPYWSTTPVKVCAYDAQELPSVTVSGKTYDCSDETGDSRKECGCGPNLRWCYGPAAQVRTPIEQDMREELGQLVDRVASGSKPYTELVLGRTTYWNGRLAFWKKNLAPHLSYSRIVARPDPGDSLGEPDFADTTFAAHQRTPMHAGVLTTSAYMLRFQTNRGRANRYRIDFECEAFVPPSTLETPQSAGDCNDTSSDLTSRCNCRYCHQRLEPMAAHWGTFSEAGTTVMSADGGWPKTMPSCVSENPSQFCSRYYVTDSDADNAGSLLAWQYADAANTYHQQIKDALTAGPKQLAQASIDSGKFAKCAAKRAWSTFLKRDLNAIDTQPEERARVEALAQGFIDHAYSLPWLIEQVVSQPEYGSLQ